ncbi:MAG TPA: LysR family transcriptional regulator [Candidatus Lachnoclostridium stercorigallinarum]|uniref:LysR family transcriptional regulator n=1 Tax=Candidatus Lachnoclostridium stercorigallinarum TaxID=2838634 RepID=A0A9D2GIM0_9FIRM|nr:LysR family transcriptional regulator [Candidatus Lachnoclostridium stercorigallinarum]
MNIRHMQYMDAIAEEGSLSRAARRLGVSQPALSNWLADLEKELQTSLFIRSGRRLILTPAGNIYLDGCRRMIQLKTQMTRALSASARGLKESIILGGSPIRGARTFACIFSDFRRKYPDVDLDFISGRNNELKEALLNETVTLSLFGATEASLPDLEFIKIADEELVLMLPPGHPFSYDSSEVTPESDLPSIELRKLAGTPMLISKSETSYYPIVMRLLEEAGLASSIIFRSNVIPLLYDMVRNGCGAALIPRAYFSPKDSISVYSFRPKLIAYQGIAFKQGHRLTDAEQHLIHLTMKNWGAPVYLRNYASYYIQKKMKQEDMELWT